MDRDFWVVDYLWQTNQAGELGLAGSIGPEVPNDLEDARVSLTISELESSRTPPNIWLAADMLAKSFYSTILTDLGQTTASPNILLNETALQYYTQDLADMRQPQIQYQVRARPGPGNGSYEDLNNRTGTLGTSPSVISTKYLCQVPRQKSTGSIIVSVVIADLVFLQALWRLFTLITNTWLSKSHVEGKFYNFLPSLRVF